MPHTWHLPYQTFRGSYDLCALKIGTSPWANCMIVGSTEKQMVWDCISTKLFWKQKYVLFLTLELHESLIYSPVGNPDKADFPIN
jgi:hypothetical protein